MNNMKRRIFMSVFGVVVLGMSVSFFKLAAFGVDPYQTVLSGLDQLTPIPYGTLSLLLNVVLLTFSLIFNRKNIGIATFINLFFLGYITQYTMQFIQIFIPEPGIITRIIFMIIGIPMLCVSSAFYFTADLGVSTYDSIALTIANKWHIWKFKYVRICTDLCCVIIGITTFLMGHGKISQIPTFVGVGTIITAFFMGPLIEFFNEKIARPFLNR